MKRSDWTRSEVAEIYRKPLIELMHEAASVHRERHDPAAVQVSRLLSIKTGGCSEDCAYCPQSARYQTAVGSHKLMNVADVVESATAAKAEGATRFCLGAAWREVKDNKDFDRVIEMVTAISQMDMEVCCTLGMLTESQAKRLKSAGLHAYNHNLDTSPEYYESIITTRDFDARLQTLEHARNAGLSVCCGGIVGLGESDDDRIGLLASLASMNPHPESVPINALVPVAGTPLQDQQPPDTWTMIRTIATARVLMPEARVRLSAGRLNMSAEAQALCFMVGANSIFSGDKLLTTPNPDQQGDRALFQILGLRAMSLEVSSRPS
ncbi:MAG: biotin synthase BioB [Acidobacteria bacterium]|nr:biotin synthase BioB [Acidobacteriota bacterium]